MTMSNKNGLLFGTVEFLGIGGFREKMISELLENGIPLRRVKFSEIGVSGEVSPFDYYKTAETARRNGVRIRAKKRGGLYFALSKYKTRGGLYVGFLAFTVMLSLWQTRVQDISISGDAQKAQIMDILTDCGITEGAHTAGLPVYKAEQKIMLEVEGCSRVDVSCEGFRVFVQVAKGIDPPEVEEDSPRNIVAARPAMIVSQAVRKGASVVQNGSGVNTGDMLVSGVFPDGGANVLTVRADAEIIGEWNETVEFYVPYSETISVADGERKTFKYLVYGDDVYPLFLGKAGAENSVYSEETRLVQMFGITMPFKIRESVYTAYTQNRITRSPDTAVSELEKRRETYEANFFADYEIVSDNALYYPEDDGVRMTVEYTLQGDIAKPVTIEFDKSDKSQLSPERQTDSQ